MVRGRKPTRMHGTTHRGTPHTLTHTHSCFCGRTRTHTHTHTELENRSLLPRNGTERNIPLRFVTHSPLSLLLSTYLSPSRVSCYSLPPLVALTRGIYNTNVSERGTERGPCLEQRGRGLVFRNTALFFISTYDK